MVGPLTDVCPSLAANNRANHGAAYTKPFTNGIRGNTTLGMKRSYRPNLIASQFGASILFSARQTLRVPPCVVIIALGVAFGMKSCRTPIPRCRASLCHHICRIGARIPQPQVRGVHTARIVSCGAAVACKVLARLCSCGDGVRYAGGPIFSAIQSKCTVPPQFSRQPRPTLTGIAAIYPRPKLSDDFGGKMWKNQFRHGALRNMVTALRAVMALPTSLQPTFIIAGCGVAKW